MLQCLVLLLIISLPKIAYADFYMGGLGGGYGTTIKYGFFVIPLLNLIISKYLNKRWSIILSIFNIVLTFLVLPGLFFLLNSIPSEIKQLAGGFYQMLEGIPLKGLLIYLFLVPIHLIILLTYSLANLLKKRRSMVKDGT